MDDWHKTFVNSVTVTAEHQSEQQFYNFCHVHNRYYNRYILQFIYEKVCTLMSDKIYIVSSAIIEPC